MANTVFILGAGASKQAGVPLMTEFLDEAYSLWKRGKVKDADTEFETVFDGISLLQQVHSKSQLDIKNVESVFAAFEMAKTLRRFVEYTCDQIDSLVSAMPVVITRTIEETLTFKVERENSQSGPAILPPAPYYPFVSLIRDLATKAELRRKVAVLTFNYDLALDYSFQWTQLPVDYALDRKTTGDFFPLLKLHGSLNWAQCEKCKKVVAKPLDTQLFFNCHQRMSVDNSDIERLRHDIYFCEFTHCDNPMSPKSFLVPPTWSKTEHHRMIAPVWERAARELAEAEDIIVIGFSLPPSDDFFRHLYALGTVGKVPLKRFWVCNPDTSGETEKRFRNLLGPGAEQRFEYIEETFEYALPRLGKAFGINVPNRLNLK